jgi:23S rRNA pseudouridine2605 synthase
VNGRSPAGPGDPVDPARDRVTLDGRPIGLAPRLWLALHKPTGYVTSRRGTGRFPSVFDLVGGAPQALVAVGRLDVMTEGLLLLTTDGELASRLMHPRWRVPRRYRVTVTGRLDQAARANLTRGVMIEGEARPARPVRWRFAARPRGGVLELELEEGRSRIVRRLCRALGLGVRKLERVAYGPIVLHDLPRGMARPLSRRELAALYRAVRLEPPEPSTRTLGLK